MAKFLKRYNTQEEYDQDLPNLNKEWMIGYVKDGKKVNYVSNPPLGSINIVLNDQWRLSSSENNPDPSCYDGVYESFSNKGIGYRLAVMYIDIDGFDEFEVYIRSYAESVWDYVMISQPDMFIDENSDYSDVKYVKEHTCGRQNSGQSLNDYIRVVYENLNCKPHRITVVYKKDGSNSEGSDQGYILIPKLKY